MKLRLVLSATALAFCCPGNLIFQIFLCCFEELAEFKVTQCVRRLIAQNMGNLRLQG